ncbi:MAG: cyanophycinase, partial [Bacteroidota bacterium]|nr:cyanophycinase [Bacteroidota bacterium]
MSARLTSPLFARLATISLALLPALALAQPIQTWRLGPDTDTQATPLGGIVLSGGAGEVDPAMQWFLQRAGGGDVLILRVSGSDGYQDYFYNELGVDVASVETIKFTAASAASADYVTQRIAEAEAIWLAGGDQSNYVDYWQGTPVEDGLHALVA